jgi:hypothetical protein
LSEQALVERLREFLRRAEYFDSEDGADEFTEAMDALEALEAERAMWKRTCLHYQSLLAERGLL